jgi:integration host factor subunit alpha
MTKAELVDALYHKIDLPKKEVQDIVEDFFEIIKSDLEKGNTLKLPGFGNFNISSKNARVGRNPKTGEKVEITARNVLTFKPSSILRDRVQKGGIKKK